LQRRAILREGCKVRFHRVSGDAIGLNWRRLWRLPG
jgi:hypothetical protein